MLDNHAETTIWLSSPSAPGMYARALPPTAPPIMAKKPNALEFARRYLRRSPKATFATIRDAAKKKRITLYPISYGRALALEGLVKSKPRKKAATKKRGPGRPKGSKNKVKRGPGRPRKTDSGLGSLDNLVATITNLQKDRDQALAMIDKIRRLVNA